jgi:acetyl-CoA C-acetyltransferase
MDPRTPVIVGVGQVAPEPGEAVGGPIAMAVQALRLAAQDSGAGPKILTRADSARHVATVSWPYQDEGALIAHELGAAPRETVRTCQFGGDLPQRLLSDTARAIAGGELDIALITGAEAVATLRDAQREGVKLDWPDQDSAVVPTRVLGSDRLPSNDAEMTVGLMAPVYNYALLESALEAAGGEGRERHMRSIAELWSRFSEVAAKNPFARLRRRHGADEIATPTPRNRPVSSPYPKLMTANLQVDQATGLIVCSAEAAAAAGVPRDRWVFIHAGAHAQDEWFMTERADLASSPAIRAIGQAVLGYAQIGIDEIAYIDLYSCFPSAVQISAAELGLATDDASRPLTVTGGLTFAGGPGNNYASHGIATLVARLREDPGARALGTALGWYATKHACTILSGRPPERPFAEIAAGTIAETPDARRAIADYEGLATIEAYTLPFDRDGEPEAAIISAITPDGARALTRTTEPELVAAALAGDLHGNPITL